MNYGDITNRINDENFILRFWVDGNAGLGDEQNVNILNPWRAVGRFYAMQVIRYLGDPAAGMGDFFTDTVLTNSNPQYSGQTGFELGGSGLDANGHVFPPDEGRAAVQRGAVERVELGPSEQHPGARPRALRADERDRDDRQHLR